MSLTRPRGGWKYEDLYELPEGKQYEIIEGELYELPSPSWLHQVIIMGLVRLFLPVVDRMQGQMVTSPLDVFLPVGNVVEPDIVVLTRERLHLASQRGVEGAPDLVIEVLSPNNPRHDLVMKRLLYSRSGVREYWIVDPEERSILVLVLEGDVYRVHVYASSEEVVTSTIFPELSFPAETVFPESNE